MPYLQLDLPNQYPADVKHRLARRLGDVYCEMMQAPPGIVSVGFRELGLHNLWRTGNVEPRPGAVIQCDIRRGRSIEQREAVARAMVAICAEALSIPADDIVLEFTQHAADEWFVHGGLAPEWQPGADQASPAPPVYTASAGES